MQTTGNIFNEYNKKDYISATGPVTISMTNDYLFRIVFQQNKFALKGLLESVLHLEPEKIIDLEIKNTIVPGQSISDKEYRMDVLVLMNDNTCINLEMQLKNLGNWQYRSLCYLCREFDSLDHGDDYDDVKPTYQIGFLDFTLFEDHPEFYAKYQLKNVRDGYVYTDRFNLIVIQLNHEELAIDEDIAFGIDKWVRLFKAKTWEELKMIAQDNEYLSSAVELAYLSNKDKNIIKVAREREDFLRMQAHKDKKLAAQADEINKLNDKVAREREDFLRMVAYKDKKLASQASEISELENTVSSQADEIERLKKLLNDNGIST